MAHFWQASLRGALQRLRTGQWLTLERARAYSLILLALYGLAIVGWIALSNGLVDPNGKPIGSDFSSFYAAGALVLDGRALDVYDMAAHYAREQQLFGATTPYYGWLYPPIFLLVATPLAMVPYPLALAIWQSSGFMLYLFAIGAILRAARRDSGTIAQTWLLAATAFPAVFINLGHGQNGFLTAGLLGAALAILPRRPLLSGFLFGLCAYKPQFIPFIPFVLIAGGHWRTVLAAGVTVVALALASQLAFGPDIWWEFAASTQTSRKLLLEQGGVGFEKLQSVFATVRMWGGGISLAYALQGAVSLTVVGSVALAWRSRTDHDLKAAMLIVATVLGSPHVLDYDLMILAPAIAFLVSASRTSGFRDYDISLLAFAWIAPLFARAVAGACSVPLGLIAVAILFVLAVQHVMRDRAIPSLAPGSAADLKSLTHPRQIPLRDFRSKAALKP
jgi:alpha-1,2-mannosyltransferase